VIRAFALSLCVCAWPVIAQADAARERLFDILDLTSYVEIARQEGLEATDEISLSLLGRPADAAMMAQMGKVYDIDRMTETVRRDVDAALTSEQVAAALIFFESDLGLRATELELAARRAMSDKDVEAAAEAAWFDAQETRPWLVARIREIKEAGDLVDRNVSGQLNSNLRFYQGLVDGNALTLSEEDILADVWAQEAQTRADTVAWLGGYMHLAYEPLSEEDLTTYVAFWQTQVAGALSAAIYAGFGRMFDDVAYATGRVMAVSMATQDL